MRPVLDARVRMIAVARGAGMPVIYTTPVSRADGADVVMLPTDLSAETGVPPPPKVSKVRQRPVSLGRSRRSPRITSFSSDGHRQHG